MCCLRMWFFLRRSVKRKRKWKEEEEEEEDISHTETKPELGWRERKGSGGNTRPEEGRGWNQTFFSFLPCSICIPFLTSLFYFPTLLLSTLSPPFPSDAAAAVKGGKSIKPMGKKRKKRFFFFHSPPPGEVMIWCKQREEVTIRSESWMLERKRERERERKHTQGHLLVQQSVPLSIPRSPSPSPPSSPV